MALLPDGLGRIFPIDLFADIGDAAITTGDGKNYNYVPFDCHVFSMFANLRLKGTANSTNVYTEFMVARTTSGGAYVNMLAANTLQIEGTGSANSYLWITASSMSISTLTQGDIVRLDIDEVPNTASSGGHVTLWCVGAE